MTEHKFFIVKKEGSNEHEECYEFYWKNKNNIFEKLQKILDEKWEDLSIGGLKKISYDYKTTNYKIIIKKIGDDENIYITAMKFACFDITGEKSDWFYEFCLKKDWTFKWQMWESWDIKYLDMYLSSLIEDAEKEWIL